MFDFTQLSAGEAARDAAIERVTGAADPDWKRSACEAVERLCRLGEDFTTDEVLEICGPPPGDPRAMTIVSAHVRRTGLAEPAGYRKSRHAACHARPKMVYRPRRRQGELFDAC